MRSASAYGRSRRSTALTTLKTAVLAPMPSATVMTMTPANNGRRVSVRQANRKSPSIIPPGSAGPADHERSSLLLDLRHCCFEPPQHVVRPDEMADVEAHELGVGEHFTDPLRPSHILLCRGLAIDI